MINLTVLMTHCHGKFHVSLDDWSPGVAMAWWRFLALVTLMFTLLPPVEGCSDDEVAAAPQALQVPRGKSLRSGQTTKALHGRKLYTKFAIRASLNLVLKKLCPCAKQRARSSRGRSCFAPFSNEKYVAQIVDLRSSWGQLHKQDADNKVGTPCATPV